MNDQNETQTNQSVCPFCEQPIQDFGKVQLEFTHSLAFSQVIGVLLHSAKNRTFAAANAIAHVAQNPQIRQSKAAVEALERASKEMEDLYREFASNFDSFRRDGRHDRPMTEADIHEMHTEFDVMFRFRCEIRFSDLQRRPLGVGLSEYRHFIRTILELSLLAVGRQPKPRVTIEYQGNKSFVSCEVRLRDGATLELDEMQFNLATIMARRLGISFEPSVHNRDRLFRWRISVRTD